MVAEKLATYRYIEIGLRIIGSYPGTSELKGFLIIIILIIINLPFQILNAVEAYGDIDMFMNSFGPTLVMFNCMVKLIAFRINHRNVRKLMNEVIDDHENLKDEVDEDVLHENMKISGMFIQVIALSYNSLVFFCTLTSISSYLQTRTLESTQYAMPATYPFIKKTWRNFGLISIIQVIEMFIVGNGHAVMESLLALLVFHASTKVHIIRKSISDYSETCCKKASIDMCTTATKNLLMKHENYLTFAKNIEQAYSYVALTNIISITLQMCVVGYVLITIIESNRISTQFFFYLNFIAADLWGVGIYCATGEYFTKQSEHIYEDLSKCPWYNFHTCNAKEMIMLLIKTQKPVVITSGKFSNLSLFYFTTIMKTSFSYLSMIRAVKGRNDNSDLS